MKYCCLALITALVLILGLTGCTVTAPGYFVNPPETPIDVNVVTGVTVPSTVTVANTPLPVDASKTPPYFVGIAEGEVTGHSDMYCIGYNPTVGTIEEDIWWGSNTYVFPATARQMRVFSGSASDNITGTGIRTLRIHYLDNTYTEQHEDINMAGTTFVNTVATNILRINAIHALTTGTNYRAVGLITIEDLAGQDYRYISIGYTRDRGGIYTVPLGKSLYITQCYVGVAGLNAANQARIALRANVDDEENILTPGLLFMPYIEVVMPNTDIGRHFDIPLRFPATADLKISAYTDAGSAIIEASFRGWIEDD